MNSSGRIRSLAGAMLALLGAACAASPAARVLPSLRQERHRPVPVVVIALDELPAASLMDLRGNIDPRAFPNFSRLAADSTWFRNTTTVGTFTKEALPALLTGTYPPKDPDATHFFPHNLFTMLRDVYDIRAIGHMPRLCPGLCEPGHESSDALPGGLDVFAGGDRGRTFAALLETIRASRRPALHFIHLLLPHKPWRFLPSGQRYGESDPMPGEVDPPGRGHGWTDARWPTSQAWQRHLLQVGLVDRLLGLLVQRMNAAGIYDEAAIVVTADHGVAFAPGLPARLIRRKTVGQLAYVPFFVKMPHQTSGAISDAPVEIVDVVPTIADALDLSATWPNVEGVSAFEVDGPRERGFEGLAFHSTGAELWRAVRQKYARFEGSSGSLDAFALAPCGLDRVVGRRVASVSKLGPAVGVQFDDLPALEGADERDQLIPALVEGELDLPRPGSTIAIAVNGRVAALTRAQDGGRSFTAMVHPRVFGPPPNEITAHLVDGCASEDS